MCIKLCKCEEDHPEYRYTNNPCVGHSNSSKEWSDDHSEIWFAQVLTMAEGEMDLSKNGGDVIPQSVSILMGKMVIDN